MTPDAAARLITKWRVEANRTERLNAELGDPVRDCQGCRSCCQNPPPLRRRTRIAAVKGSKQERRPGVWRLRVYVGRDPVSGVKRMATRTFHGTERQAETELARFVVDTANGGFSPRGAMTVASLLTAYCDHSERIGRSPTTVAEYRRLTRHIADGLGRAQITSLQPHHLEELYGVLGNRGVSGGKGALSPASVNRYHNLLKSALRQAVRWGLLEKNPADRATAPREPKAPMRAPSPSELHQLVNAAAESNPAHGILIALAAMTGARRGEVCALRWSDVDIAAGVLHIRRAVKQVGNERIVGDTKTHEERSIALPDDAIQTLDLFTSQVMERSALNHIPLAFDPYLFSPDPNHGQPYLPKTISGMFYRVAKKLGLPYHLHQLRHFAATQLIAAGHDAVTVGNRLGHADPSVTLRVYAHALEDRDRAAAETLGGIVSQKLLN